MNTTTETFIVPCEGVDHIPVTVISPTTRKPLPLVVFQHGPDYLNRADLIEYWTSQMESGALPLCRIALIRPVNPGEDDAWLADPTAFEDALVGRVLPAIRDRYDTIGPVVLVGASVGALMALSCSVRYPTAFGALFLQSGSFFCHQAGDDETYYPQIQDFVVGMHAKVGTARRMIIGMTCGAEPNLLNNQLMARTLRRLGHCVQFDEVGSTHDFESWGRCLDPLLTWLLQTAWA
jgi:enterochelin esterase family protein